MTSKSENIKRYPLSINVELFDKLKKYSKSEYKLINPKIIELIVDYVNKMEEK